MIKHTKRNRNSGFTIVELLIATAVFSMVLTVAIIGFLQIGKIYYKGITVTRTHEAAKETINSIKADISFASAVPFAQRQGAGTTSDGRPRYFFCAGPHRYTFVLGKAVNLATWDQTNNFGLIKDEAGISGGCGNPFGGSGFSNPQELLGNRMRVADLTLGQVAGVGNNDLYTVYVKLAYGENANLQNPTQTDVNCNSELSTSQYCHVSELRTTVRRGIR